jgi:hypothetical protein
VALEGFMVKAADSWSLPQGATAPEALKLLAVAAVRLFAGSPAGALMRALTADAQGDPDLARALREQWFGPRRAVAAAIIQKGIRAGQLRSDLDVEVTLDLVFAPIYYRLVYGHEPLSEAFAEQSVDQVLHGIVAVWPPGC